MGNWAYLRKHWIRPEVYPLIGSMAAALGVCGAAMLNKVRDPSVTWDKTKRGSGVEAQLEGVDEIVPMWSSSKSASIRIFGKEGNPIMDNKNEFSAPISVTIAAENEAEDEEVEAETEADQAADEPAVAEPNPVINVVDEAAEVINAAVDAAIQGTAAVSDTPESAAASVAEPVAQAENTLEAASPVSPGAPNPSDN